MGAQTVCTRAYLDVNTMGAPMKARLVRRCWVTLLLAVLVTLTFDIGNTEASSMGSGGQQ
jgi:hypothetical protein